MCKAEQIASGKVRRDVNSDQPAAGLPWDQRVIIKQLLSLGGWLWSEFLTRHASTKPVALLTCTMQPKAARLAWVRLGSPPSWEQGDSHTSEHSDLSVHKWDRISKSKQVL